MKIARRQFIGMMAGACAGGWWAGAAENGFPIELGVCTTVTNSGVLKNAGFDYIEESVARFLAPDGTQAEFERKLEAVKRAELPVWACNSFFPESLPLVGTKADHEAALKFGRTALERAAKAGVKLIVLGSGKARRVPEGFEAGRAKEQFIAFCRKLGPVASDSGVTIVLEPLNRGETNLLHTVAEGIEYVDAIGHAGVQLMADWYHMAREEESPDSIRKAGKRLRHCHVAERRARTAPGTDGDDFRPYFRALRDIGYGGRLSVECGWKDMATQAAGARAVLVEQMGL